MPREIDPSLMKFETFAQTIIDNKYAKFPTLKDKQTWPEISKRVSENVFTAVPASRDLIKELTYRISIRQIIPGGRYLYAAGRDYHQVQNCLLMRAEDSREGWSEIMQNASMALMSGAGIGIEYSNVRLRGSLIKRTGGEATGPTALMQMVNESGRHIMQGGSRRSAIWAGLGWDHSDIFDFINIKNWSPEVRALKAKDFNFPAPMDGTNVSVRLDGEFFRAYNDTEHPKHLHAHSVYWLTVKQMLKTGEPGFSIDVGENEGETLRNAPICAGTAVLAEEGYVTVSSIAGKPTTIWTGKQWANDVVFKQTQSNADIVSVEMTGGRYIRCEKWHPFLVERHEGSGEKRKLVSIDRVSANDLEPGDVLHVSLPKYVPNVKFDNECYTLGYVYGDGTFNKCGNAEITFCTEESKTCVEPMREHFLLSSVNESDGRGYKRAYFKVDQYWENRSKEVFPIEAYYWTYNQAGSFLAGLFDSDGNWEPTQKRLRLSSKNEGFLRGVSRLLEQYGILSHVSKAGMSTFGQAQGYQLVVASDYTSKAIEFIPTIRIKAELGTYESYRPSLIKVVSVTEDGKEDVYCADVKVEEHSFMAEGVIISNCTEVSSYTDSDICNLLSINLARVNTIDDMRACVEVATALLVAGTEYSHVPYGKVLTVREANRRLGLGLMGIHEWLIQHGKKYGPDDDLSKYLDIYAQSTVYAHKWEQQWGLSKSVKTRAIAPTGTIGIVAETTTGCEPVFCIAFKRRYLDGTVWKHQYVIETIAERLVQQGIDPETIEDAYSIKPETRVEFQTWLQQYVDHGISSTINLPAWGSEANNEDKVQEFGDMLIKYLPKLRGITCYPDGARGGQPLTAVSYKTAKKHVGEIFYESSDICDLTKGGTCGS